tara:strand:+ start:146 stop:268 length:123 start_codon:yes stop_codon:yes gene_type:complete
MLETRHHQYREIDPSTSILDIDLDLDIDIDIDIDLPEILS